MSEVGALIIGTVLAIGALAFVLHPLFFFSTTSRAPRATPDAPSEDSAIVALREIEFDRATGKLSDTDYSELRATYGERALSELRASAPREAETVDAIEARVRDYRMTHRECPTCGLRPETDAVYCSTCGTFLDGSCPQCSTPIAEPGAVFCSACGATLAAARA